MISRFDEPRVISLVKNIEDVDVLVFAIFADGLVVNVFQTDQVFYEVSLSVEDAYMVTNNKKHFPQTPHVVTPTAMLAILTDAGIIRL